MQRTLGNRTLSSLLSHSAEREADLISGSTPEQVTPAEPTVGELDRTAAPDDSADISSDVDAERDGGRPLPAAVRAVFEPAFGVPLRVVRVHDGEQAHRLNQRVHAEAFTSGADIFFRQGGFRPETATGRQLLAHELVHVLQQRGTARALQRKPRRAGGEIETLEYSVDVPASVRTMDDVFRLYERVAFGRETHSEWICGGDCDVAQRRGRKVRFRVERLKVEASGRPEDAAKRKQAKEKLGAMSGKAHAEINAEADRRYSELTGAKKTDKIRPTETGNVRTWENQLAEVVGEAEQLAKLPPAIKELLSGGSTPLPPKHYPQFLRIAGKLATLSTEDLAAFKLLAIRGTTDIDLFEKSVDMFIARKAELVKALEKQKQDDTLQGALDERLKTIDEHAVATMSEDARYDLARKMTSELTEAQLKYMKDHPGETLKDFGKSALLLNTPDTFRGIGHDLAEAASGDANSWARWAAGTGAGAKISGWLLALAGIVYVASWLTGVGELVTIAAAAGVLLGTTITLSAVESELRIKAASQAKDPAEFKRHIQAAAAARANVIVSVGLIVVAALLHITAKTAFPKTMQRISRSMAVLREKIRIKGSVYDVKPSIATEMRSYRGELVTACDAAKADAIALSKELSRLSTDEFTKRLESGNGDFLDHTKAPKEQRVDFRELAKSPEGRAAIEEYRQRLVDALAKDVPAELDGLRNEYTSKVDKFLADVEAAKTHEDLRAAVDGFEPALTEDGMKAYLKGRQEAVTATKIAAEQDALAKQAAAQRAKQAVAAPVEESPARPTIDKPTIDKPTIDKPATGGPAADTPAREPAAAKQPAAKKMPARKKATPKKRAAGKHPVRPAAELPPGVRPGKLRQRALEMIAALPEAERLSIEEALRKLPPAEAAQILTDLGRAGDLSAFQDAVARRNEPPAEVPEGPEQPRSALDPDAKVHVGEEEGLTGVEKRPPARVSETEPGVSRAALKGRMTPPEWAHGRSDLWNPHHLIPMWLENHPVLEALRAHGGWDHNAARNGYPLPTRPGIKGAENLPVHQVTGEVLREAGRPPSPELVRELQGHPVWNEKVRARLEELLPLIDDPVGLRAKVEALIDELRAELDTAVKNGRKVLF
jgi:hypothetical protein